VFEKKRVLGALRVPDLLDWGGGCATHGVLRSPAAGFAGSGAFK
jgi:hypothetical protein